MNGSKELLSENSRLIWLADLIESTLPGGRTRRYLQIVFNKAVEELESLGQERAFSFFIFQMLELKWPQEEVYTVKVLPLP